MGDTKAGTLDLPAPSRAKAWQSDLQAAFRRLDALLEHLQLDRTRAPEPLISDPLFPILVPRSFAARMRKGDWRDPLLLQVLPLGGESEMRAGFTADAVGDAESEVAPGLLHKYRSRALLLASPHCAVHCRYCFRREFPYSGLPKGSGNWEAAWRYLETDTGLDEVILSGGDPLFLETARLAPILDRLAAIPHIRTLRLHTRLPVVLPSRVDGDFLELARRHASAKTLIIVVHANHPAELTRDCPPALEALRATGALLLNQSVLLKGVNDDAGALAELSRRLLRSGVLPYYLHQLDRVAGTAHFEVEESRGLELMEDLRAELPGYAVPRYVREVAGENSKRPMG